VLHDVKDEIDHVIEYAEIEFLVSDHVAVCIRAWGPIEDFLRHAEVAGKLKYLVFVKREQGLEIDPTVAVLDEESLEGFGKIRCPANDIVTLFCRIAEINHPRSLLDVIRGAGVTLFHRPCLTFASPFPILSAIVRTL